MSKITDRVWELARPVADEEGCRLWDVEYIREAGSWYLRVYLDKEGGVAIDDCERVSRRLDPMLDEDDMIPESYIFEVCSAGADRALKRPSDFQEFMGAEVELKLYQPVDGRKSYVGALRGYDDGAVTIALGSGEMRFDKTQVALVRLHVTI